MRNIQFLARPSCPWEKDGYIIFHHAHDFTYDPDFHSGSYYVQEASSMLIGNVLSNWIKVLELVIDLCVLHWWKDNSHVIKAKEDVLLIANEVVATRLGSLKIKSYKMGIFNLLQHFIQFEN